MPLPWELEGSSAGLRIWHLPAVVVTPDCGVDKMPDTVLVAPIFPLQLLHPSDRDGVRIGTFVAGLYLPADPDLRTQDDESFDWPESYIDLNAITPVAPGLLGGERIVALSDEQIDRLHEAWVRFGAGKELSSTGSIEAAKGKRISDVVVVQASKKRYTVELAFDDGSILVLYREPGRKSDNRQSVRIDQEGAFTPTEVQALVGTTLILRFENDSHRDWNLFCPPLAVPSTKILSGQTKDVLIDCPLQPFVAIVENTDKRTNKLTVRVVA
jgi:hypothetical protein